MVLQVHDELVLDVPEEELGPASELLRMAMANAADRPNVVYIMADELGYYRYWVAEHHASPALAGAAPRQCDLRKS